MKDYAVDGDKAEITMALSSGRRRLSLTRLIS